MLGERSLIEHFEANGDHIFAHDRNGCMCFLEDVAVLLTANEGLLSVLVVSPEGHYE